MKSKIFTIIQSQWVKGLYIAVGGAVIDAIYQPVQALISHQPTNFSGWQLLGAGLLAATAYIKVTFLSNSNRQLLTPEVEPESGKPNPK
jgi:hypothetical protein